MVITQIPTIYWIHEVALGFQSVIDDKNVMSRHSLAETVITWHKTIIGNGPCLYGIKQHHKSCRPRLMDHHPRPYFIYNKFSVPFRERHQFLWDNFDCDAHEYRFQLGLIYCCLSIWYGLCYKSVGYTIWTGHIQVESPIAFWLK